MNEDCKETNAFELGNEEVRKLAQQDHATSAEK